MQRQTAVTAYLKNKQLLLFAFACTCRQKYYSRHFENGLTGGATEAITILIRVSPGIVGFVDHMIRQYTTT